MTIILNHTIVPSHDKVASAKWFADIFGLTNEETQGHFAPVHVNDTLTLDFEPSSRLLGPALALGFQSLADRMVNDFIRVADEA